MQERELRDLIEDVRRGTLPRRSFIQQMVGLGPDRADGVDDADARRRGAGADRPSLQAHQARRRRCPEADLVAGRGAAEPALRRRHQGAGRHRASSTSRWPAGTPKATWCPMLAAEMPIARERRPVGRRQERDLEAQARRAPGTTASPSPPTTWSSTADYAGDPATATVTVATYKDIKVEKVDSHTVRVDFPKPTPFWAERLHRQLSGMIMPKHVFEPFIGAKSRESAGQRQAGGHRAVQVRRLQAGRHGARRGQHQLPHAQPALLRHARDEGRRRRAVAPRARCCRPANTTSPGTCRSRTRCSSAWRPAARASWSSCRAATSNSSSSTHRPVERGRRRARQRQEQAPGVQRQGGARRDGAAGRPQGRAGLHLRPQRHRHGQLPEQPAALPQPEHEVRVQRRQGQPDPRSRGLEEGRRRHPRQGQREAEVRLPDLGQPAAPEDAGRSSRTPAARPASTSN